MQFAALLAVWMTACLAGCAGLGVEPYGARVAFRQDSPIRFRDFELTYLGERRVKSKVDAPGFVYFEFRAVSGGEQVPVTWTAGTGQIVPARFEVAGEPFLLELGLSQTVGALGQSELVVRSAEARR